MNTITVNIKQSDALSEWMRKEEGSYEDHNKSESHVYAILSKCKGKVKLTEQEANAIIKSGTYHGTAWDDEDIRGGAKTKAGILRIVALVKIELGRIINSQLDIKE